MTFEGISYQEMEDAIFEASEILETFGKFNEADTLERMCDTDTEAAYTIALSVFESFGDVPMSQVNTVKTSVA